MTIPTIEPLKIGIKAIKDIHKKQDKWQKTFDEMFNGHFIPTYNTDLEIAIIDILNNIYNDKETLSWWIYEMDFGKEATKDCMWDENGKNIPMKTIEDVYNYYKEYTLK